MGTEKRETDWSMAVALLPFRDTGKNCSEGVKKVNARPTELWDRGTDCGNMTGCGGQGGGREAGESRRRQAERLGPAATGRMLPQPGEAEARQPGDADRAEAGLGHRDAAGDDTAAAASGQRRPEEVELCRVSTAPTRGHLWEPAAAR